MQYSFAANRIVLALCSSAACFAAQAAGATEFSSRVFGVDKSQVIELGPSRRYILISTEEIVVTDGLAEGHPLNSISGPCAGAIERNGSVRKGGGYCLYSNAKGGKWLLTWEIAADGKGGAFQLTGTEGDAAGWKGSGRWGPSVEFPQGRFLDAWSGSVEKP
jgi:hypothetical protein